MLRSSLIKPIIYPNCCDSIVIIISLTHHCYPPLGYPYKQVHFMFTCLFLIHTDPRLCGLRWEIRFLSHLLICVAGLPIYTYILRLCLCCFSIVHESGFVYKGDQSRSLKFSSLQTRLEAGFCESQIFFILVVISWKFRLLFKMRFALFAFLGT